MIIRTPTRTKTQSFRGQQMDFQFPTHETLIRGLNKPELESTVTSPLLGDKLHVSHEDDTTSQIFSEYTSNTNTNSSSSNGYYSFANISDNTTSPKYFTDQSDGSYGVSVLNIGKAEYPTTLAPDRTPLLGKPNTESPSNSSKLRSNSQMQSIPEISPSSASIGTTVQHTIKTADNTSYDINSSKFSHKDPTLHSESIRSSQNSVKRLQRVPTIRRVSSMSSTQSFRSGKSNLKRSNAIRCRGGLLYYFSIMGIKIRKNLKRLRIAVRKRLFSFTGSSRQKRSNNATVRNSAPRPVPPKKNSRTEKKRRQRKHSLTQSGSLNNVMTTSHLMRTQGYVSNLQRSASRRSLEPVLKDVSNSDETKIEKTTNENEPVNVQTKSTLRRTNSSIRRAASILTSTPISNEYNNVTRKNSANSTSKLVKSMGSTSLNSIVRQPSIVVKNKVIPLSMSQYSIKEEDEYGMIKEEDEESDDCENIIKTARMVSNSSAFSPIIREQDEEEELTHSIFENTPKTEYQNDFEEIKPGDEDYFKEEIREKTVDFFNSYLSNVINQRIMLRLQIAKYQESNLNGGSYNGLLKSMSKGNTLDAITEEDQQGEESDFTDSEESDTASLSESVSTENESLVSDTEEDNMGHKNITMKMTRDFARDIMYHTSNNASLLSFPNATVRRSMTLPTDFRT